ncbi:MAG: hypothetical protein GF315_08745 [candidate division Zixibacteria bacterium]|nr:hypothetical protein [candidate division Zixibacteria bacterium]
MRTLRRYDVKHSYYFITICTWGREELLLSEPEMFWASWIDFKPFAWIILPDHFHIMIENQDVSISDIVHRFKIRYSRAFRDKYKSGRVWQNRFWDHIIRNDDDFNRHLDYIHYNPVKHEYIDDPFKWKFSSLSEYYKEGYYTRDWGNNEALEFKGEFGE